MKAARLHIMSSCQDSERMNENVFNWEEDVMDKKPKPFNRDDCLPELPEEFPEPRIRIFLVEEDPKPTKPPMRSIPQEKVEAPWDPSQIKG